MLSQKPQLRRVLVVVVVVVGPGKLPRGQNAMPVWVDLLGIYWPLIGTAKQ